MTNLKLKGFILGLICLFAFNLNAQKTAESVKPEARKERPHKTPEQRAQHKAKKMSEKLGLNEKQQAEIYALNLQEIKDREEKHNRTKDKLQAEQMARYKTVLTTEQYTKLEKAQAERAAKRAERHENRGKGKLEKPQPKPDHAHSGRRGGKHKGGHRKGNPEEKAQRMTDRMAEKLGLDDKQKAAILKINKQEINNRERMRKQAAEEMRAKKMANYKNILTAEQFAALEKWQVEREKKHAEWKEKHGKGQHKN